MLINAETTKRFLGTPGLTKCSIPIYNTNNACATGSTGLHLARTLIKNGAIDCALVIGFEQMQPGSIKSVWSDRPSPMVSLNYDLINGQTI
jgi:acetyl-CoA acetyltransferase